MDECGLPPGTTWEVTLHNLDGLLSGIPDPHTHSYTPCNRPSPEKEVGGAAWEECSQAEETRDRQLEAYTHLPF